LSAGLDNTVKEARLWHLLWTRPQWCRNLLCYRNENHWISRLLRCANKLLQELIGDGLNRAPAKPFKPIR